MKYQRVHLQSMAYELAPNVVSSSALEHRLRPLYDSLRIQPGQLQALTGIRERRWWDPDHKNAEGAVAAARKTLARANVPPEAIGVLIYGGVCRDHLEPATACDVAAELDLQPNVEVYDISNACLGVLNGILAVANRIELGQIRAGLVVSCETAREINDITIDRMLKSNSMESYRDSIATLTGGSGAVAVLLTDGSFGDDSPRLLGGILRAAPEHHALCRWEIAGHNGSHHATQQMVTDAVAVQRHGVDLGLKTWTAFLSELDWTPDSIDRVICHQVGRQHQEAILAALGIDARKDFSTYEFLGNMGTVSLPLTASLAGERGAIRRGDRVGFLGIGSGLNCLMLGWEW